MTVADSVTATSDLKSYLSRATWQHDTRARLQSAEEAGRTWGDARDVRSPSRSRSRQVSSQSRSQTPGGVVNHFPHPSSAEKWSRDGPGHSPLPSRAQSRRSAGLGSSREELRPSPSRSRPVTGEGAPRPVGTAAMASSEKDIKRLRKLCRGGGRRGDETVEGIAELAHKMTHFFRGLTVPQQLALARNIQLEESPPGDVIFRQGEAATKFYMIVQGRAGVAIDSWQQRFAYAPPMHSTSTVTVLQRGDSFGEIALLQSDGKHGAPRTATVTAQSRLLLLVISKDDFMRVMGGNFAATIEERESFLRTLRAFQGVPAAQLQRVAKFMGIGVFAQGAVFFPERDHRICFIVEGRVRVRRGTKEDVDRRRLEERKRVEEARPLPPDIYYDKDTVCELRPGCFFGEACLWPWTRRDWYVEASTKLKLYFITRPDAVNELPEYAKVEMNKEAAFRLSYNDDTIKRMAQREEERQAARKELMVDIGRRGGDDSENEDEDESPRPGRGEGGAEGEGGAARRPGTAASLKEGDADLNDPLGHDAEEMKRLLDAQRANHLEFLSALESGVTASLNANVSRWEEAGLWPVVFLPPPTPAASDIIGSDLHGSPEGPKLRRRTSMVSFHDVGMPPEVGEEFDYAAAAARAMGAPSRLSAGSVSPWGAGGAGGAGQLLEEVSAPSVLGRYSPGPGHLPEPEHPGGWTPAMRKRRVRDRSSDPPPLLPGKEPPTPGGGPGEAAYESPTAKAMLSMMKSMNVDDSQAPRLGHCYLKSASKWSQGSWRARARSTDAPAAPGARASPLPQLLERPPRPHSQLSMAALEKGIMRVRGELPPRSASVGGDIGIPYPHELIQGLSAHTIVSLPLRAVLPPTGSWSETGPRAVNSTVKSRRRHQHAPSPPLPGVSFHSVELPSPDGSQVPFQGFGHEPGVPSSLSSHVHGRGGAGHHTVPSLALSRSAPGVGSARGGGSEGEGAEEEGEEYGAEDDLDVNLAAGGAAGVATGEGAARGGERDAGGPGPGTGGSAAGAEARAAGDRPPSGAVGGEGARGGGGVVASPSWEQPPSLPPSRRPALERSYSHAARPVAAAEPGGGRRSSEPVKWASPDPPKVNYAAAAAAEAAEAAAKAELSARAGGAAEGLEGAREEGSRPSTRSGREGSGRSPLAYVAIEGVPPPRTPSGRGGAASPPPRTGAAASPSLPQIA